MRPPLFTLSGRAGGANWKRRLRSRAAAAPRAQALAPRPALQDEARSPSLPGTAAGTSTCHFSGPCRPPPVILRDAQNNDWEGAATFTRLTLNDLSGVPQGSETPLAGTPPSSFFLWRPLLQASQGSLSQWVRGQADALTTGPRQPGLNACFEFASFCQVLYCSAFKDSLGVGGITTHLRSGHPRSSLALSLHSFTK